MNLIHDDLLKVLDAVEIESRVRYSLLGEPRTIEAGEAADPFEPAGV